MYFCPLYSEHVWGDPHGGRSVVGVCGRGVHSAKLGGPGGAAVAVPRHGVGRAAAAGPAGETAAAAQAAAAGQSNTYMKMHKLKLIYIECRRVVYTHIAKTSTYQ